MRSSSRPKKIAVLVIGAAMLLIPATSALAVVSDLSVTKTAAADVIAGANITYTITVGNAGPEASELVTLADATPTGTTFVSFTAPAGWTCQPFPAVGGTGPISCTHPSLAPAASEVFTFVVKVDLGTADGTVISNTATVATTPGSDANAANDTATATSTVGLVSELCTITGTNWADELEGTTGDDVICAGNGHDTVYGLEGNDVIAGGNGRDVLFGGLGDDTIFGRNGKDQITGDAGLDLLVGGNGKDVIDGSGDATSDALYGGNGKDECVVDPGTVDVTTDCP